MIISMAWGKIRSQLPRMWKSVVRKSESASNHHMQLELLAKFHLEVEMREHRNDSFGPLDGTPRTSKRAEDLPGVCNDDSCQYLLNTPRSLPDFRMRPINNASSAFCSMYEQCDFDIHEIHHWCQSCNCSWGRYIGWWQDKRHARIMHVRFENARLGYIVHWSIYNWLSPMSSMMACVLRYQ